MDELLYILKVAEKAQPNVAKRLKLNRSPSHIRLSSIVPLSNYGYTEAVSGAVLDINNRGIIIGVEDRPEIPRDFVSWTNVAYIADAADLSPP